jgi:hypothetical protein
MIILELLQLFLLFFFQFLAPFLVANFRDIRKLPKFGLLLALSFVKTLVEKNGGTSKYRTQGQTFERNKTQVETV